MTRKIEDLQRYHESRREQERRLAALARNARAADAHRRLSDLHNLMCLDLAIRPSDAEIDAVEMLAVHEVAHRPM